LDFRDSQDSRASLANPASLDFQDSQASRASLVSRAALAGTKGIRYSSGNSRKLTTFHSAEKRSRGIQTLNV